MRQLSICRLFAWLGMLYLMLDPSTMASAQEPPYSPDCQKIADQIKVLEGEKQSIASDLGEGKVPRKPAAVAQVNKSQSEISRKKGELSTCVKEHPYIPPPPPKWLSKKLGEVFDEFVERHLVRFSVERIKCVPELLIV
jgi:hypothetical protein